MDDERMIMEDDGRDPRLVQALRALDPGSSDPGYWFRLHRKVMSGATDELARRRMMGDLTVSDLLTSWSRTLVPGAVLAAAMAAFLLLQEPDAGADSRSATAPMGVEEVLVDGLEGPTIPAALAPDARPDEWGGVFLASESF